MAVGILMSQMTYIVPKFSEIFGDLMGGKGMPALTQFVMNVSEVLKTKFPFVLIGIAVLVGVLKLVAMTKKGRYGLDYFKLHAPVPVLQALNIVKETVGNDVISKAVTTIHDAVKEGENMAPPIASSKVFPPMVISMVEVGEETGALPDMLMKVADSDDEDVDNAVASMTSIIEPLLIIFLAVVVGSIVIALFMPLISIMGSLAG